MKLPDAERAVVEKAKVERYLLSPTHAHGRHKQRVFVSAGCTVETLTNALLTLARTSDNAEEEPSPFGRKFVVRGSITGRTGSLAVTTVWMLRSGKTPPYFVTAYPAKR